MLLLAFHRTPSLTRERYEAVVRRLTGEERLESPADLPFPGLVFHAAGETDAGFCVFDVFESEDAVARFNEAMQTIPREVGIEEPPEFFAAHTVIGLPASPLTKRRGSAMSERDEFLAWVRTTLYDAELALHNGDPAPRRALWSRNDPVSVLGAWRNASGQAELDQLFTHLGQSFSDCTSFEFELHACDVLGHLAYTAWFEHTSASVNGEPRTYTLRVTQVYRREDGEWRVAHRHGDTVTD